MSDKTYKRIFLCLAVSLALSVQVGCRRHATPPPPETGNIKIGVLVDLAHAGDGPSIKNAIEFSRDEINQAGGVNGRQLEVLIVDYKGAADKDAAEFANLISQNNVQAIIWQSPTASAVAASQFQASGIPLITVTSPDPNITEQGGSVFNITPLDSSQGQQMGAYAANNLKARTAAILTEEGSANSFALAQSFADEFSKRGGQVSSRQTYKPTDQSFGPLIASISQANPDVLYVPGRNGAVTTIAGESKQQDLKAVLLGADGWNDPKVLSAGGHALDGAYITSRYSPDDPSAEARAFNGAYKKRFEGAPDQTAALAYDATRILVDALKRSANDRAKLRDALQQTVNFSGLTGVITIGASRNATRPAIIFKLQDGKVYPVYKEQ